MAKLELELKNGTTFKRNFYNGVHYFVDHKEKVVKLHPEHYLKLLGKNLYFPNSGMGFKKIGGSWAGDIFNMNPYSNQFVASLKLMSLGMPMLNAMYVDAGTAIEPKVIQALEEMTGKKIVTYDANALKYDYFKKQEHFGGLPDGFIEDTKVLLELKTAGVKKYNGWKTVEDVPSYYRLQAQLYAHLMGSDVAAIVAYPVERHEYDEPEKVIIDKSKIKVLKMKVDHAKMEDALMKLGSFRQHVIDARQSLPFDPDRDAEIISYLECRDEEETIEWLKTHSDFMGNTHL